VDVLGKKKKKRGCTGRGFKKWYRRKARNRKPRKISTWGNPCGFWVREKRYRRGGGKCLWEKGALGCEEKLTTTPGEGGKVDVEKKTLKKPKEGTTRTKGCRRYRVG